MKIFGRDVASWSAFLIALVAGLAAYNVPGLDAGSAFAIGGLITAVQMAVITQPRTPGVLVGLVTAVTAVLAEYGLHWTDAQVTALSGLVLAGGVLFGIRPQVTPNADPQPIR